MWWARSTGLSCMRFTGPSCKPTNPQNCSERGETPGEDTSWILPSLLVVRVFLAHVHSFLISGAFCGFLLCVVLLLTGTSPRLAVCAESPLLGWRLVMCAREVRDTTSLSQRSILNPLCRTLLEGLRPLPVRSSGLMDGAGRPGRPMATRVVLRGSICRFLR